MVVLETSQEWLKQSALLLQARPTTTIVTTKYRIDKTPRKPDPRRRSTKPAPTDSADAANTQQSTANITFKTWEPASGVCLKYRTNKAAEVGRLFGSLGQLGRGMTGAGQVMVEDTVMPDVPGVGVDEGERTDSPAPVVATTTGDAKGQAGGGASKSKKKKGKR